MIRVLPLAFALRLLPLAFALRLLPLAFAMFAAACENTTSSPDLSAQVDMVGGTKNCRSDSDCPAATPMCAPDSRICVGCISSFETCGAGLTCDETTHTCIPADPKQNCTRTSDCPRPGFDPITAVACLVDAGMCVACVSNMDCVAPDTCQTDYTCKTVHDGGT